MAVAVRCPECRRAAQVGADALGLLVHCPSCREPFVALEEATPVARPPMKPARPVPPPLPSRSRARSLAEPVTSNTSANPHAASHSESGGMPVSVLFGFALLPLAIPLLWLIGPHLLAKPPALTLAAPTSLAIAASVLCLAVVLTVDWSPLTRIKGVLILVGLAYFAGLSLYFLKREVVERVKDFFTPADRWHEFSPQGKPYKVMVPKTPAPLREGPLKDWPLTCYACTHGNVFAGPEVQYVVGSGPDLKIADGERWFDQVEQALTDNLPGSNHGARTEEKLFQGAIAKRWVIEMPNGATRVVRVFRMNGTVFYQSVESEGLDVDSPTVVKRFFDSFHVGPPPGK